MLIDGSFETAAAAAVTPYDPAEMEAMLQEMQTQDGLLNFTQAATLLGVSKPRVTQLVHAGTLRRFSFCGHHYVSMREVRARAASEVKTGRPKGSFKKSITAALQTDRVQAKQGGYAAHHRRKPKK